MRRTRPLRTGDRRTRVEGFARERGGGVPARGERPSFAEPSPERASVPCSRTPFKILNIPDIETILNILYTRVTRANIKYFERRRSMWTNAYSYEDIGEFLREARRARGITQVEMARKLGFSSVTLSALETGKNVSAIKVDRYLQQLGFRMVIVPKGADVEVTE